MINFQIHKLWNLKPVLETTEKNMEQFKEKWVCLTRAHLFLARPQESQVSYIKVKTTQLSKIWS